MEHPWCVHTTQIHSESQLTWKLKTLIKFSPVAQTHSKYQMFVSGQYSFMPAGQYCEHLQQANASRDKYRAIIIAYKWLVIYIQRALVPHYNPLSMKNR